MADQGVFLNEDFNEEFVWSVANERDDYGKKTTRACKESCDSSACHLPAAPRKIPRANTRLPSSDASLVKGSSDPMDIPDWSKIYGKSCEKGSSRVDVGVSNEGDDDEMIPPHEWIAKKLARSQISSFSVCEGMGRTLKGRDLSKVRNAVLTKTGFIEK
ncbi:hypothetical protein Fmac_009225 [Flemingia macrophylla]|uniref:Senescence regulator n=1 Tax=Flemingia macrophylla TaxID=520843 RepID=A0ABD1N252_9FABA